MFKTIRRNFFQLKTFPMKLKMHEHLEQAKIKVNLSRWTNSKDNKKITTIFRDGSPSGL